MHNKPDIEKWFMMKGWLQDMAKVVTLDADKIKGFTFDLEEQIFSRQGIEFISKSCQTPEEVADACEDADVILTVLSKLPKEIIEQTKNCKAIMCYGIGYDQVDIMAAGKKGIPVCNVPHYCSEEVAVHTMALLLGCLRKVGYYNDAVKGGIWNSGEGYFISRTTTMTLGLMGFGSIARNVAAYAKPFGFRIIVSDPYLDKNTLPNGIELVEFDQLLAESDILSLHAPLTDSTRHALNKETLKKVKDGVIVLNTSRGPLIHEMDLVDALRSGKVKAAGLDVLESEPLRDKEHPLCKMEQVILTPHAGHVSLQATHELHQTVADNAVALLSGEKPKYIVNEKFL